MEFLFPGKFETISWHSLFYEIQLLILCICSFYCLNDKGRSPIKVSLFMLFMYVLVTMFINFGLCVLNYDKLGVDLERVSNILNSHNILIIVIFVFVFIKKTMLVFKRSIKLRRKNR